MAPAPGSSLGPYSILSLLGAGGMGEVYRARDPRLGRDVAIKVVSGEGASDPARRARFEQEARAAAALNHPHILAVHDIGTAHLADGPTPYVVSELLDGETLRERLTRGKLPVRVATELAVQIARALAAAHEHGIVVEPRLATGPRFHDTGAVDRDEILRVLPALRGGRPDGG